MSRSSNDRLSQDMSELGPTSSRRPARELRARCCCLVGAGAAGTVVSPDVSRSRVPVRDEVVVRRGGKKKKQLFLETITVIVGLLARDVRGEGE